MEAGESQFVAQIDSWRCYLNPAATAQVGSPLDRPSVNGQMRRRGRCCVERITAASLRCGAPEVSSAQSGRHFS